MDEEGPLGGGAVVGPEICGPSTRPPILWAEEAPVAELRLVEVLMLLLLLLLLALGFGLNSLTTFPVLEMFENPRALLSVMMSNNKTTQAPFLVRYRFRRLLLSIVLLSY